MQEIFMSNFERTEFSDSFFSVIGRTLTIVTRFEQNCKNLNLLLLLKENKNIFENKKEFQEFTSEIYQKKLFDQIEGIVDSTSKELADKLHTARKDRNYFAHNFMIGFDDSFDFLDKSSLLNIKKEIKLRLFRIAEADMILSLMISIHTNEKAPNNDFLSNYANKIILWILGE